MDEIENLKEYLEKSAHKHKHYKFYGKKNKIENFITNKSLFLSCGNNWNDKNDKLNLDQKEKYVRYAMCFNYSKEESIAMWMLYQGISKDGLMIDFLPSLITKITNDSTIYLGEFIKDKFKIKYEVLPNCYKVELIDVAYKTKNKNIYFHNDKFISCKKNNCKYNVKEYAWKYENECRLIISINRNKMRKNLKYENYVLMVALNKELLKKNMNKINERIYYSPNYYKKMNDIYSKSEYNNKIDWKLI